MWVYTNSVNRFGGETRCLVSNPVVWPSPTIFSTARPHHWYLGNSRRQARELILGPCLGAKVRFLSFNRTQYRVVTGLLTLHITLRRHLHLQGLSDSPLCRRCGAEDETPAHILCECEASASHRHAYLGSFFLYPEDMKSISLGAFWNFSKVVEFPWIDVGHKEPVT